MHGEACDMHLAGGGKHVANKEPDQGGLSSTRRPNKESKLAALNCEAYIAEGNVTARVGHRDSLQLNNCALCCTKPNRVTHL
jgi:hypothetical protein